MEKKYKKIINIFHIYYIKVLGVFFMKFIRYGEIPPGERSINFIKMSLDDNADFTHECKYNPVVAYSFVKEKDLEIGVSCFYADKDELPIIENEKQQKSYEIRIKEKCVAYLVSGNEVGKGIDGEPLIRDIKIIKKIS